MGLCATIVCVVLCGAPGGSPELRESAFEGCRVTYHRGHESLARQVGRSVGAIIRELDALLGVQFREPVRVWLAVSREEFNDHVGEKMPEWSQAVADLERNAIVVRADRLGVTLEDAALPMLRHELCHLALHLAERGKKRKLPVWLHEGVASYVSGGSVVTEWQAFDVAAAQGALIPLARLAEGFPERESSARLAYLESEDFVRFLCAERSKAVLQWILDAYERTGEFEEAVKEATGETLGDLEARWQESYRVRFPWLKTLWQATTLFGVLGLGTIAAYWLCRMRAKRMRVEWEREDWRRGKPARRRAHEEEEEDEEDDEWGDGDEEEYWGWG